MLDRPLKPVMSYHGAKSRLAHWIMSFFPKHHAYVEPFGGAAGVMLQKPRSLSEVYNDLDADVVNVFRVLQDKEQALELERKIRVTPYSREEFEISYDLTDCAIENARRTLIRAHMGFGSAGATKHKTGFRMDSAREYGTAAHLWTRYPDEIANFIDRFQSVIIENKAALEVIENHDRADTLFFVDPPYVHSTRKMRSGRYYRYEMDDSEHIQLLEKLKQVKGFVVISGYDSELYHEHLEGWQVHKTTARISAGRGTAIRTECVWMNPLCSKNQVQTDLFNNVLA